jgi:16S rRNA processing protein RimM
VHAGRVGRAHGLDGSFYVTRALARLLEAGTEVSVGGVEAAIVRRAGTDKRPIVRLAGTDTRAGAEALRGADITVPRERVAPLAQGEWWAHELEGCDVVAGAKVLGEVRRLLELPSCEVLEVARGGGQQDLLIPLVKDAVVRVEVERGLIEVDPDFLDIEGQGRSRPAAKTPRRGA